MSVVDITVQIKVNKGLYFSISRREKASFTNNDTSKMSTLVLICSKVFHLFFPLPRAPSKPSSFDTFTFFCEKRKKN
jgi:hypothetical protein